MEAELLAWRQPQLWVAAGQVTQGDLSLQLAQIRPQAVVEALPEGQVPVSVRPAEIELVWMLEHRGISACGRQP